MYAPPHLSQPQVSHSSILPSHQYQSQMDHQTSSIPQNFYHSPQVSTQLMTKFPLMDSSLLLQDSLQPTINLELPLIWETRPLSKTAGLLCNKFKGGKDKVMPVLAIRVMLLVSRETIPEGRQGLLNAIIVKVKDICLGNALSLRGQGTLHDPGILDDQVTQTTIPNNPAFQTKDLDAYDSDCDDVSNAIANLMAILSNYGSDVILEDFKQTPVVDFSDNEINSDSNIIPYSQYLQETQQVQTNIGVDVDLRRREIVDASMH
ncbi:hypothetical protein Tco_0862886 [Tanacetum coccineum]